jgi:hypothetical protein
MEHAASNGGPYGVHCSGAVAEVLRQIQRRATAEGRGADVLLAFRQAIRRLRQAPMYFGEPLYRLPALRMQVRSGVIAPLVIHFAVCEDRPLVFIRGADLLAPQ